MTREQAIEKLRDAVSADTELAHVVADEVLCDLLRSLGFEDVVEAFDAIDKWYA